MEFMNPLPVLELASSKSYAAGGGLVGRGAVRASRVVSIGVGGGGSAATTTDDAPKSPAWMTASNSLFAPALTSAARDSSLPSPKSAYIAKTSGEPARSFVKV